MTYCGKCGARNPDDSRFCWQCGAKLMIAMVTEEPPVAEEPKADYAGSPVPPVGGNGTGGDYAGGPAPRESPAPGVTVHRYESAETVRETVHRQDPELKDGFTMIDENTVGFAGKRYSIDPHDISNYRAGGWICIVLFYLVALYLLFSYDFHWDGGIDGMDATLYEIATGGYEYVLPVPALFWLTVLLVVLSALPFCGEFAMMVFLIAAASTARFTVGTDVIIGTLETTYTMPEGWIWEIFIMAMVLAVISGTASWLINKATMPALMKRGSTTLGAMMTFYTGTKY